MLQHILKEVKNNFDTKAIVRPYYNDIPVYDLKFGGTNLVNVIYHLMYDNATRYLSRKKEIFDQFLVNGNLETKKFHNNIA